MLTKKNYYQIVNHNWTAWHSSSSWIPQDNNLWRSTVHISCHCRAQAKRPASLRQSNETDAALSRKLSNAMIIHRLLRCSLYSLHSRVNNLQSCLLSFSSLGKFQFYSGRRWTTFLSHKYYFTDTALGWNNIVSIYLIISLLEPQSVNSCERARIFCFMQITYRNFKMQLHFVAVCVASFYFNAIIMILTYALG